MPDNHSSNNSDRGSRRTDRFPSQDKATDAMSTLRRMPESLAAEAAVIGSMIIDPVCIGDVIELLNIDSFYRVEHQYIFEALLAHMQEHFKSEEKLMQEVQYPSFRMHKGDHDKVLNEARSHQMA